MPNFKDVTKFYDFLGESYLSSMYTDNRWTSYVDSIEKGLVLKLLHANKRPVISQTILDLGMGPGRWSLFFVERGFKKVSGIDISPKMVAAAKKRLANRQFEAKIANMEKLPFKAKSFDTVFCFRAIKYTDYPEQVFKEVRRVMKDNGQFLVEVSNQTLSNLLFSLVAKLLIILNPNLKMESRWRYFYRAKFFSAEHIRKMAQGCNLKVVEDHPLLILPSIPLPSTLPFMTAFLILIDKILFSILPKRWFARSWVFLITK